MLPESLKGVRLTNFIYLFIYLPAFWTQACPEGMCTNGTHSSHARCHPCPIPQPVRSMTKRVDRIVMQVLLHLTRTNQWKCCETAPTVFRPYLRRLESRTICRCHLSYLKTLSVGLAGVSNPQPPARQTGALPTELTRRRSNNILVQ